MTSAQRISGPRDSYTVATTRNVVILVWREPPSMEGARRLEQAFQQLTEGITGKLGLITVAEEASVSIKDKAAIQLVADILRRNNERIGAGVIVHDCQGLKATLVRSAISTINLMARVSFPNGVFGNLGEGVSWLASALGLEAAPLVGEVNKHRFG